MKIAIVGGGTAGWIAANHIGAELAGSNYELTVIESKDVPTIGVGEGTVPHIKRSLEKFGISEAELISSCNCTLKQGIKFQGWMAGEESYYYHPFASPFPGGYDATSLLISRGDFHQVSQSFQFMEQAKSAKAISSGSYEGVVEYAYHFDATSFGALLKRNALKKFGVKHKVATIDGVEKSSDGCISNLITADGEVIAFDFYIDCSGFSAMLIGRAMGSRFQSMSDRIITDTVLATRKKSTLELPIPSYTLAKAHGAGWLWDIPLQNRRGVGFVYASSFMSESLAAERLASHCNISLEDLAYKKLDMKIGFRERAWIQNCVSLGLAHGFVEPLEATSIFLTDFSAELLARNLSSEVECWGVAADHFNRITTYAWNRVIDFIQLHYFLSDRRDSEFWRQVTDKAILSDELLHLLDLWQARPPLKSDFFSRFDLFDVDNYLYVLYGMRYPTKLKDMTTYQYDFLTQELERHIGRSFDQANAAIPHNEWLKKFNRAVAGAYS